MENNVLNALDFLLKSDSKAQEAVDNGYDLARMYSDEEWLLKMVAYASQLSPVPDRIKIVVPSDDKIRYWVKENLPFQSETSIVTTKWLIESIRTLNPGAEVVESNHPASS